MNTINQSDLELISRVEVTKTLIGFLDPTQSVNRNNDFKDAGNNILIATLFPGEKIHSPG